MNSDKEDSRSLHVTVHKPTIGSTGGAPTPLLSAAFTFDDHIRSARLNLTSTMSNADQQVHGGQAKTHQGENEGQAAENASGGKVDILTHLNYLVLFCSSDARSKYFHFRLLELPTSVGTACPSPPQHTLSSLR